MVKVTQRLTREDWILAGYRALAAGGVAALRVEPVARALATTKGSFYWHFADPADWRSAMLDYWEEVAFRRIIAALEPVPPGLPRLHALARVAAVSGRDPSHGGAAAEPALREWARYAPDVAVVVRRVDAGRIAYVTACLQDIPAPAQDRSSQARQFYATVLGLQALQGEPEQDAADLIDLVDRLAFPAPGLPQVTAADAVKG
jgi:AcrR family transcriptional regulator